MIPMIHKILFILIQKLLSVPFLVADLLSPSFYFRRLRLRVVECKQSTSPNLAIFVVYQKNGLSFSVKNMVEALIANRVKVVVAVNGEVSAEVRAYLESTCHKVIYRKNTGRDFGAFQDALNTEVLDRYQKVFLINDSVFYFKKNLKKLVGQILKGQHNWAAIYENFNVSYHAQSFFLCFGGEVLRSDAFKSFWTNYRPFNLRHHVISHGELALSRKLVDAGFYCHVSNNRHDLSDKLGKLNAIQMDRLKVFLTVDFLKHHSGILNKCGSQFIHHLNFIYERSPSPVQDLYPIFCLVNDSPIFKRDLVKRHKTTVGEFHLLLKEMKLDPSEVKSALAEFSLQSKSAPKSLFAKIGMRYELV